MMEITKTSIQDVYIASTSAYEDHRGAFQRVFCGQSLKSILGGRQIVQANYSRTEKVGAIRGMHYQAAPRAEVKMVRCIRGRVWDVAVDLRRGSPTFLKWHSEELTPESGRMIVIPEGCAHGFQVIEPSSELLYLHTAEYSKDAEGGVRFDDPRLRIHWPLEVTDISIRDKSHPLLTEMYEGVLV
jgi:dTDP-4-dehydrorhamnose 3,5-epimerase